MKFSNPDAALRASGGPNQCGRQIANDGAQVVAPVEPQSGHGQLAVGELGELDGAPCAAERGIHLADEDVGGLELLAEDAGLPPPKILARRHVPAQQERAARDRIYWIFAFF